MLETVLASPLEWFVVPMPRIQGWSRTYDNVDAAWFFSFEALHICGCQIPGLILLCDLKHTRIGHDVEVDMAKIRVA